MYRKDDTNQLKFEDFYLPFAGKLRSDNRWVILFNIEYSRDDYVEQFTIRIPENLAKLDRIENIYKTRVADTPEIVFEVLDKHRNRLEELC